MIDSGNGSEEFKNDSGMEKDNSWRWICCLYTALWGTYAFDGMCFKAEIISKCYLSIHINTFNAIWR
jgi:hypothetical protein